VLAGVWRLGGPFERKDSSSEKESFGRWRAPERYGTQRLLNEQQQQKDSSSSDSKLRLFFYTAQLESSRGTLLRTKDGNGRGGRRRRSQLYCPFLVGIRAERIVHPV
jgi:hypothetical protein